MGYEVDGFFVWAMLIGIFFLWVCFKLYEEYLWFRVVAATFGIGLTLLVPIGSLLIAYISFFEEDLIWLAVIQVVLGWSLGGIAFWYSIGTYLKFMKETFGKSKDEIIKSKPTSTNNIYSKEENSLIKRNYINTNNNKVSADLIEYRDFIVFNEYTIGKEVYGASMNEEFHTYIKILNEDIGKFNYDLILKFINESTSHEKYTSPSISLKGLCREYSIKFEEKYEKLKELTDKDSYDENS